MLRCARCGKKFDKDYDRETFEMKTLKNYDYLTMELCAECATNAIENQENGIYYEVCESCGKRFDPFDDEVRFRNHFSDDFGASLNYFNRCLCFDCAVEAYDAEDIIS